MDGTASSIFENEAISQFRIEGSISEPSPVAVGPSFSRELRKAFFDKSDKGKAKSTSQSRTVSRTHSKPKV
jgi:hypothetical protein